MISNRNKISKITIVQINKYQKTIKIKNFTHHCELVGVIMKLIERKNLKKIHKRLMSEKEKPKKMKIFVYIISKFLMFNF